MSQSSRTGKTREGSPSKSLEERRGANVGGMEPETMKKHDSELALIYHSPTNGFCRHLSGRSFLDYSLSAKKRYGNYNIFNTWKFKISTFNRITQMFLR